MTTTYKEDPENKIAELVVDGKVRHEDFNNIAVQLENFIEKWVLATRYVGTY